MHQDQHLERYLRFCQRLYLRLQSEGEWPWPDSPNPEDLVESDDT